METTVKKLGIDYTYNQVELNKIVNNTIDKIKNYKIVNNYKLNGDLNYYNFKYLPLSKRQMKKIQKYCFWIQKNPSLKRINSFFSLLSKNYGVKRVKINIPLKEQKIQNARKEWLKVRNESERLLDLYKKEKGDFYKN